MPSTQKKQRSSKLFQCTGYGDCKMVFTRGEHLARHVRKHTGEKPYPCIIPDCNKSFSRFDNMMQHTQTHRRNSHQPMDHQQPQLSPPMSSRVLLRQPQAPSTPPTGSESPDSLSSVSSYSSDEDDEEDHYYHPPPYRRLSVADMCNPMDQHPLKIGQLTNDEVEVIQAFDQLRHATF
ncbi:hypothetical protein BC941DRAFT_409856 [Chlamydoabsidia padenii]|nr:hypothetical protein BC941DRAFT_409856 [Chlamydoabsidia padenii]